MNKHRVTSFDLSAMKARGEKIAVLTAYDYAWGRLIDEAGIDVAMVGDSLGMVVLGYDTTLQVTMDDMVRHTAAVARGAKRAMIVADMPFLSYQVNDDEAVGNAGRLVQEGQAQAVKLEGGNERIIGIVRRIVDVGIPVFGHVGLTPQSVHQLGTRTQGRDEANAARIRAEALALQDAGVCAVVFEKIPAALAKEITESLAIPTIGIGAGPDCDGQVLVTHDILGLYDRFKPPFARQYANLWEATLEAFKSYGSDVKEGRFPER